MKKKLYALYKGEKCLDIGTISELAEKYKVRKETLYFYQSPTHLKRMKKSKKGNYKVLVKIED